MGERSVARSQAFSPTFCVCVVVGIERDVNPGRWCASAAGRLSSLRVYNWVFLRLRRQMHLEAAKILEDKNIYIGDRF